MESETERYIAKKQSKNTIRRRRKKKQFVKSSWLKYNIVWLIIIGIAWLYFSPNEQKKKEIRKRNSFLIFS